MFSHFPLLLFIFSSIFLHFLPHFDLRVGNSSLGKALATQLFSERWRPRVEGVRVGEKLFLNSIFSNRKVLLCYLYIQITGLYSKMFRFVLLLAYKIPYILKFTDLNSFEARHPIRIKKDQGSSAILTCDPPEGSPLPEFYWTVNEPFEKPHPVRLNDRVNLDNATGNLVFANVLPTDSNYYYRCNAKNSQRMVKFSDRTELIVQSKYVSGAI